MTEELKIYWKLYEELYSNDEILKNFNNLITPYIGQKKVNIIDIGCGQSSYLLDFKKESDHILFACDTEPFQINSLKKRINKIESTNEIYYSSEEFPNLDFKGFIFSVVIVSNLLHFMKLDEAKKFIKKIESQIKKGTILLFKVHSWKHHSKGDYSYFKHFFKRTDFYKILNKKDYEYLYFEELCAEYNLKQIKLMKLWVREYANKILNLTDEKKIIELQNKQNYRTNSYTVIVRKK